MKFISVLFMAVVPLSLFASNDEIDVKHKNGTYIETRSIENLPDATIENQIVSFDNVGIYSLYIEDDSGTIVYSSALPADGMEYNYDLSTVKMGLYRLVLSGYKGEYEGCFSIN